MITMAKTRNSTAKILASPTPILSGLIKGIKLELSILKTLLLNSYADIIALDN